MREIAESLRAGQQKLTNAWAGFDPDAAEKTVYEIGSAVWNVLGTVAEAIETLIPEEPTEAVNDRPVHPQENLRRQSAAMAERAIKLGREQNPEKPETYESDLEKAHLRHEQIVAQLAVLLRQYDRRGHHMGLITYEDQARDLLESVAVDSLRAETIRAYKEAKGIA